MKTPVLFLVFNRPECTARAFESIRKARPERLYVAADGARNAKDGEAMRCAEVRKIATNVDWPCQVQTLFRDENVGCKQAVAGGIDWFFEHEGEGIVLEDDVVPGDSFFPFVEQYLDIFRNDSRIGLISGFNPLPGFTENNRPFVAKYPYIWGWATWRRVWKLYSTEIELSKDEIYQLLYRRLGHKRGALALSSIGDQIRKGDIDTWDFQLALTLLENELDTIYPPNSLVQNIGFDNDATHTKMNDGRADIVADINKPSSVDITEISYLSAFDRARFDHEYPSVIRRISNKILKITRAIGKFS